MPKKKQMKGTIQGAKCEMSSKNQTQAQLEVITLQGCRKKGDGNKNPPPPPPTVSKKMLAAAASGRQNLQKTSRTIAVFVETSAVPVQNKPLWGITEENQCWPFYCFISHCSALLPHSVPYFVYVCFPELHHLRHCTSSSCVKCEVDRMLLLTFPVSYKCVEKTKLENISTRTSCMLWMSMNVKSGDTENEYPWGSIRNKELAKPLFSSNIWHSANS